MQRLVEMVNTEAEREILFDTVKNDIVELAYHPKGNYVLLLIIKALKGEKFDFVTS